MSMCPVDGRMLVESHDAPAGSAAPIRLSQATEALLGNILDSSAGSGAAAGASTDAGRARRRHDEGGEDNAATLIGPPPGMTTPQRHDGSGPGTAATGVTETTVSNAYASFKEVTLSKPLAALLTPAATPAAPAPRPEPPSGSLAVAPLASLEPRRDPGGENAVTHRRLPRVQRGQSVPDDDPADLDEATAQPARRRDVFGDLHMEFGVLAADVTDDAVTRRVARASEPVARTDDELPSAAAELPFEPSLARRREDPSSLEISIELSEDLVDSEDTQVGPHRDEIPDLVRRRNPESTVAAPRAQLDDRDATTPHRGWWMLAIVVLAVLAAFVWVMALS